MSGFDKAPTVSVIMGAYNEENRLKETIESTLDQTFTDFEFIIVDDGSKDRTAEILEQYAAEDNRIKIITNDKNVGLTKALNKGLEFAKGRYIARIDAGDYSHPERLAKQVDFLSRNGDIAVLGTFAYWVNKKKEVIGICRFPTTPNEIKRKLYGLTSVALHPSLLIKKEVFDKTGPFDVTWPTSMEYELFLRTNRYGYKMANIPDFLVYILRDDKGISVNRIRTEFVDGYKMRVKYLRYFLNPWNIFNTVLSLFFIIIPPVLLIRIVDFRIYLSKKFHCKQKSYDNY